MIDAGKLSKALRIPITRAELWMPFLEATFDTFSINTPKRQASFLAQISVESGGFRLVEENLNYSAAGLLSTFRTHFTPKEAASYSRNQIRIANRAYANRFGNGDEASGDGWKYRGRGLIQITFKNNYGVCGKALNLNLVSTPELLIQPKYAALSAGWYWNDRGCNQLADRDLFITETRKINGGTNGEKAREAAWENLKKEMGI